MSKIQSALTKLQGARSKPSSKSGRSFGDSGPSDKDQHHSTIGGTGDAQRSAESHFYGGRYVEVDLAELGSQGLRPPDNQLLQTDEEYKSIKRPLLKNASLDDSELPRSNLWMITSSLAGEGKTFSSINLALSIARERDRSIVLVDLDRAKAHISRVFNVKDEPGFLDLLQEPGLDFDSLVMPTNIEELSLMPVGKCDGSSTELLSSSRMASLCAAISSADPNRIVLFDTSPLLLTSEASALASQVGQVILLVQAGETPKQAVLDAYHKLDPSIPANLILTHADARESVNAYGGYGYGHPE